MSPAPSPRDFYVTGGTMPPDAGSYITRAADDELFEAVGRSEYCYVLTTRQMGKSSLMARTAARLSEIGVRSAQLTLETTRESSAAPNPDQFLYGIASRIHRELKIPVPLADWWRDRDLLTSTQRFYEFLTELLLEHCAGRIVVFIDEIDSTIGLPFADDFYATLRACFNGRASKPELKCLTFVLLGVAAPAQLISDPTRTPFNVGKGIHLTDFTSTEVEPLGAGFAGAPERRKALLHRVLYWTGGHPYLTQTLCQEIAVCTARAARGEVRSVEDAQALVDEEVNRLFLRSEAMREERNLKFVRSRLTQGADLRSVLGTYRRVLSGKRIQDKPASSVHASLKLAGVVRVDRDGNLRTRNRIYRQVFGLDWVKRELPRDRARLVATVAVAVTVVASVLSVVSFWRAQLTNNELQRIEESQKRAGQAADATLQRLVALSQANPGVWNPQTVVVNEQLLRQVSPAVLAVRPWSTPGIASSKLLDVIAASYHLFVPNRELFGAMMFSLEEIYLRDESVEVRKRARELLETVRQHFIELHEDNRHSAAAVPPAGLGDDTLNAVVVAAAGDFLMGSSEGDSDEKPTRTVSVSRFAIQQHEVTNDEYRRFDPSHAFPDGHGRHPVANVSWYEAMGYAAWLGGTLPTEAQWEYAAGGPGTTRRRFPWGDVTVDASRAIFDTPSALPVGSRPTGRTPDGIDDMAGNVWEWCRDWYGLYAEQSQVDPLGPTARDARLLGGAPLRVVRGGAFGSVPRDLRAANRNWGYPDYRGDTVGFRVVSSPLRP